MNTNAKGILTDYEISNDEELENLVEIMNKVFK